MLTSTPAGFLVKKSLLTTPKPTTCSDFPCSFSIQGKNIDLQGWLTLRTHTLTVEMAYLVVVIVLAAAVFVPVSAGKTYIVGDSLGWTVPPEGVVAYSDWASKLKFMAGDILVFNFTNGHSVATVSTDDFDSCNTDNGKSVKLNGPANYTLDAGDTYFICLVDDHCVRGQQLAVTASATGSPTSSPSPRPSTDGPSGNNTPPTPPERSFATRVINISFIVSLSLVIVYIF